MSNQITAILSHGMAWIKFNLLKILAVHCVKIWHGHRISWLRLNITCNKSFWLQTVWHTRHAAIIADLQLLFMWRAGCTVDCLKVIRSEVTLSINDFFKDHRWRVMSCQSSLPSLEKVLLIWSILGYGISSRFPLGSSSYSSQSFRRPGKLYVGEYLLVLCSHQLYSSLIIY